MAWFETKEETDEGPVVHRVDRTSDALVTKLYTLAELLHAAGQPYPALGAEATSRDIELAMEAHLAGVPRLVHVAQHQWEENDAWTFLLTRGDPAERKYLDEEPPENLTKMALARLLELTTGRDCRRSWNLTNAALIAALAPPG